MTYLVKDYSFYILFAHLVDEYWNHFIVDGLDFLVDDEYRSSTPEIIYEDYSEILLKEFIDYSLANGYITINYSDKNQINLIDYSQQKSININDYSETIKPDYIVI